VDARHKAGHDRASVPGLNLYLVKSATAARRGAISSAASGDFSRTFASSSLTLDLVEERIDSRTQFRYRAHRTRKSSCHGRHCFVFTGRWLASAFSSAREYSAVSARVIRLAVFLLFDAQDVAARLVPRADFCRHRFEEILPSASTRP